MISCKHPAKQYIRDIDGNTYLVAEYDGKVWMTDNLMVTRDADGKTIISHFPDDNPEKADAYGLLYDFESSCKVCPKGWHLPTLEEWRDLVALFGESPAGQLKDSLYWNNNALNFSNASGFSVRPSGYWSDGRFNSLFGSDAVFWTSTRVDNQFVWGVRLRDDSDSVRFAPQHPEFGFSVRCVED